MTLSPSDPASSPLLSGRHLHLKHGAREVLNGIDITVRPGEIVTLIGPNGAGKTSLVRVLLKLLKPTRGEVRWRPGMRVGYMPQRLQPDPAMPLDVHRFLTLNHKADRLVVQAALAEVDAAALLDRPLQALSGGELQRVSLARALLRQPDMLVLDEPAQGVDVIGQSEIYQLIAQLRERRGCGVLVVSHDLHLVMAASDSVYCLNGHICCTGRPEDVSRHPEYLRLFGPAAPQGVGIYAHHHDHSHGLHGGVLPHDCDHHDHAG